MMLCLATFIRASAAARSETRRGAVELHPRQRQGPPCPVKSLDGISVLGRIQAKGEQRCLNHLTSLPCSSVRRSECNALSKSISPVCPGQIGRTNHKQCRHWR
jgi:hypothetical protein